MLAKPTAFIAVCLQILLVWGSKAPLYELTDANFDTFIAQNNCVFVFFFVPDCKFCHQFDGELAEVAEKLGRRDVACLLAKANMRTQLGVKARQNIFEYPTNKLFFEGHELPYLGAREHVSVTNFIVGKVEASSMELETMEEFEEVIQAEVTAVLLMPQVDPPVLRTFQIFFSSFEDIFFFHSVLPEALAKWTNGSKYNFLVFLNGSPDPKVLSTDQPLSLAEIKVFFDGARFPVVMELDGPGSDRIFNEKRTTVFLFAEDRTLFQQEFLDVALRFNKWGVLFVRTDFTEMMGVRMGEYFLMDLKEDAVAIRALEFREGRPFRHALNTLEEGALIQFLEDVLKGKGKPYFRSEPVPVQAASAPLKKVVGKNFDSLVLQSPQSFLLVLVSPDCGHCKQLAPEIDVLAQQYAQDPRLLLGKMDGTVNEIESLEVPGFPLIVFYPADDKENPVPFSGDRTAKAISAWLEQKLRAVVPKAASSDEL